MPFKDRAADYVLRVEATLDQWMPAADTPPERLHAAMRHAVLNGGKRLRPLLVYATAEMLDLDPGSLDPAAAAVELIHCYSLVHDDLPAMDDDDLRRGHPTVHKAFDEATAILAGDALHSLAFAGLAGSRLPAAAEAIRILAGAAGSLGMVGGQALDLQFESTRPEQGALEEMFRLKTGALIRAAALMAAVQRTDLESETFSALSDFGDLIGLAFQIRDDLLDVEGDPALTGKRIGADLERDKATWPGLFGVDAARSRSESLMGAAGDCLCGLPGDGEALRWLAGRIVKRAS